MNGDRLEQISRQEVRRFTKEPWETVLAFLPVEGRLVPNPSASSLQDPEGSDSRQAEERILTHKKGEVIRKTRRL